jgi:hypothetical protein
MLIARREFAKSLVDRAVRKVLRGVDRKTKNAFLALLWNVQVRSDLLRPGRLKGRVEADRLETLVGGLMALTSHRRDWLRPVGQWEPRESNASPLFSSLAHHLLAYHPVPPVMLSAWFRGLGWPGYRQQCWFKCVGRGASLVGVDFPLRLTRRMAFEFANAPVEFSIPFALRWAQVRGLGGSDGLARAFAAAGIPERCVADEFWIKLIHFLINHPELDRGRIASIVGCLHDLRFAPRRVIIGEDTEIDLEPARPDLSIKGWTVQTMLRRVDEWNAARSETPPRRRIRWPASGIDGYRRDEGEAGTWTIRELLDSDALAAEGKAMDHCVATYTEPCARRETTIWSLELESGGQSRRAATIEVNPLTRELVQAKGKENAPPDEPARRHIDEWARRQSLTDSSS